MAERQQYQDHAGDAEVAANPDQICEVENEVDEQGDSRKHHQPEVKSHNFLENQANSHFKGT